MIRGLVVWLLLLWVGCSQNYSEKRVDQALAERGWKRVQSRQPAPLPEAGERQSLGGVSAVVPKGWQSMPPSSSMRVAEYLLSGEPVQAADGLLAVFFFGKGQGGGIEANIERWYSQFSQSDGRPTQERAQHREEVVRGMPVTLVDIRGTYLGNLDRGEVSAPQPGYRMLGAVVQSPAGSFFFKLTGPEATVAYWAASFEEYIGSLEPE